MAIPNQGLKVCKKCGKRKRISSFPVKRYKTDRRPWVNTMCLVCSRKYHVDYYHAHHDRYKEKMRVSKLAEMVRVKAAVFAAYGGYVCKCCGETEQKFLTIDHVNNDGYQWRKTTLKTGKSSQGSGHHTYAWLVRNNFPDGFQVLCMNCNFGKRMNKGICPHQTRRNDHPLAGVGSSEPKRTPSQVEDDMVSSLSESKGSFVN